MSLEACTCASFTHSTVEDEPGAVLRDFIDTGGSRWHAVVIGIETPEEKIYQQNLITPSAAWLAQHDPVDATENSTATAYFAQMQIQKDNEVKVRASIIDTVLAALDAKTATNNQIQTILAHIIRYLRKEANP